MAATDDGDAFDHVLAKAEVRLATVCRARAHLRLARRVQSGGGAIALVAVAVALLSKDRPGSGEAIWIMASLSVAAVGMAAVFVTEAALVLPARRQVATNERIMLSEVNRLRELFTHIAWREGWDDERIRATRHRLSQFPIEGRRIR